MKDNNTEVKMFEKDNLVWMGIGVAVIALGMFLMAGGKSSDPKVFNKEEVYSTMRITVAPILILAGLFIGVFAIFKKPKES
jgi:H+/Cl- antiporter ClcA